MTTTSAAAATTETATMETAPDEGCRMSTEHRLPSR